MGKLKVAILEDNQELLKDLKKDIEDTQLAEVVFWATNSKDFLDKSKLNNVEALILDIELCGDSMSGIDVANKLKLPVLFISGKSKDFIDRIEDLNVNYDFPVESLMKPVSLEKLTKILTKFKNRIRLIEKSIFVFLDFKGSKRNKIDINSIVFLESELGSSGQSNNKKIYFIDRKPEILIDFSFSKMSEKGFDDGVFRTTHKSFRVNKNKIKCYNADHTLDMEVVFDSNGGTITKQIPVSENYRPEFRKFKNK